MKIKNRDAVIQAIIKVLDNGEKLSERINARLKSKHSIKLHDTIEEPAYEPETLKTSKEVIAYDSHGKPILKDDKNILRDI